MQILPYVEFVGGCRGVPSLDGELDVLEALLELAERHEGGGAVCGGGGEVLSLVRGRVDGRVAHGLRVEDDRQLVVPRLEGRVAVLPVAPRQLGVLQRPCLPALWEIPNSTFSLLSHF